MFFFERVLSIAIYLIVLLFVLVSILDKNVKTKVLNLYTELGLEYKGRSYRDYLDKTKYDKKNIAKTINFILIDKIGNALIHPVKEGDLV